MPMYSSAQLLELVQTDLRGRAEILAVSKPEQCSSLVITNPAYALAQ